MNITINNNQKISEIRDTFHAKYPFLKLEFFSMQHEAAALSKEKNMISHDKTIGECRTGHKDGIIEVSDHESVAELEQAFQKFGLSVQVFRLMGINWIETTKTDSWTLYQQNIHGQETGVHKDTEYNEIEMDSLDNQ